MGRAPCCSKVGLHRGAWSDEEDKLLTNYIQTHGEGQWRSMPSKAGLLRCGKSCRLRWMNYLRPGIKRGNFTAEEDDVIVRLHSIHGSRWSFIANELLGRTDNEIKNHWNSHLKQKIADDKQSDIKNEKKKRKNNQKSKKVKTVDNTVKTVPDQLVSTTSTSLPSSQSESASFDCGSMSGASSSSTIDQQGDIDLLMTDFSWPNWSPLFEIDDGALSINGQDDISSFEMPLDGLDLLMMKHDESKMLEKLYDECLQLIEDGDGY
ncbi:uncharacterized protein [Rutidosis leptorrhynchoides]|uniref:uncharacterized protein n=1 Tax=Rutidosis leptorrhynchoides TaxID=125765 RepID=UPI003A99C27A